MKSLIFFVLLATFANIGYSQHYYNDIITTQQTNRQYNLLKAGHIQQVSAKSYEANGEPSENFVLEQTITGNGASITTTAEYPSTGKSVSLSLYTNGKVAKTTDSTENIKSVTVYSYNGDNLVLIDTHTEDGFMNNASHEIHQWIYENNQPVKMLKKTERRNICRMDRAALLAVAAGKTNIALINKTPTAQIEKFTINASRTMNA